MVYTSIHENLEPYGKMYSTIYKMHCIVMYPAYAKWIQSHRDLPLKLNQWCNVVVGTVFDVLLLL